MKPSDRSDPVALETPERLPQSKLPLPEVPGLSLGSGDEASGEISEALFRD
jgi:hypothetical protein